MTHQIAMVERLRHLKDSPRAVFCPIQMENKVCFQLWRFFAGTRPLTPSTVYIGKTASLTFLQFLRQTIRQQMGPSTFTESARQNVMLEADAGEITREVFEEGDHELTLIDTFYAAVCSSALGSHSH
jgi:hypothetical protein